MLITEKKIFLSALDSIVETGSVSIVVSLFSLIFSIVFSYFLLNDTKSENFKIKLFSNLYFLIFSLFGVYLSNNFKILAFGILEDAFINDIENFNLNLKFVNLSLYTAYFSTVIIFLNLIYMIYKRNNK